MAGSVPISVRALPGAFPVAEIEGLSPRRDSRDEASARTLRDALWTSGVICVRLPRALDDDEARELVSMIGQVKDPVGRTRRGGTLRYGDDRQIIDSGFVMTDEIRAALGGGSFGGDDLRPGLFEFFHTDDSYTERPAAATVLHARQLPTGEGGDTCFIDMRVAFQLLTPAQQERTVSLRAVHAYNNGGAFPPRAAATGAPEELVEVAHPIVRAHPVTGQPALYFDLDRAVAITGLPIDEGRELLRSLQEHAEQHAPRYAHRWRDHDVLIWDNASVQHRASSDFAVGEPRRFWRYMVAGPEPLPFTGVNSRRPA
jgi:alpha-ketoglutarate-dependent taurine dioxygenase